LATIKVREVKNVALGAMVVFTYMALVLLSGRVDPVTFGKLLYFYIRTAFWLWAFVGGFYLLGSLVLHGRRAGTSPFLFGFLTELVRERWERDRMLSLVWPPLLFACLLASFNAFKQMILPLAGFHFDPLFAIADRLLFLGNDPWRLTHAVFGSPGMTLFIDRAYHGWFAPMSLGLVACAWMPGSTYRLRTQYMLSYIGVWIGIGSILAFLLPSAGPCFYEHFVGAHSSFNELLQRLGGIEAATGSDLTSLRNQGLLIKLHASDNLVVGGGISAMPSVHNGLAALFALAASRLNRVAGWVLWGYAALIWLGSIHLGWHYALDGIVGIALTYGIWIACGRIAEAFDKDAEFEEPAAALA
jgi:hypothetical protein